MVKQQPGDRLETTIKILCGNATACVTDIDDGVVVGDLACEEHDSTLVGVSHRVVDDVS